MRILLSTFIFLLVLAALFLWPQADLAVSHLFYRAGEGFALRANPFCLFMQGLAYYGARVLGVVLLSFIFYTYLRHTAIFTVSSKGWLFLFLALIIGPGLIANGVFKDHWGRARPREVIEFGGTQNYSGPWMLQDTAKRNGSFVSGDASFGFFLPSFAYVVPSRRPIARRFFWGGIALGALFGVNRIIMGAHFLSDVLFAAAFMLATSAGLYGMMYNRKKMAMHWRDWFFERG